MRRAGAAGARGLDQFLRLGGAEAQAVQRQAGKARGRAGGLAAALERAPADAPANVAVVGCGPAGLALAAAHDNVLVTRTFSRASPTSCSWAPTGPS